MSHGKQAAPPIGINGNLTSNCPVLPAVPEGCLELQHVCFDQAAVVLHGKDLQPSEAGAPRSRLPSWIPQVHANFPYPSTSNPDYMQVPDLHLPQPLLFRPVSQYEPSQELADPQWSCHVPMLLQTVWPFNYGHTLVNTAGWLYEQLVATQTGQQLAERAVVAMHMPWGLALPSWSRLLLQPMARHPITTLADLSSREGTHSRCFASALLCDIPDIWGGVLSAWQAAQHSVDHYRPQWQQAQLSLSWAQPSPHIVSNASSSGSGDKAMPMAPPAAPAPCPDILQAAEPVGVPAPQQHVEQQRRVWQVLFQTRGANAGVRELLNLEQLLDSCANWKYRDEASGTLHTAKCGRWDLMGLPDAMAAAQLADVMVGVHGSNIANLFFMRPCSSVVEVMHPEFQGSNLHHAWLQYSHAPINWFGLAIIDSHLTQPGIHEQRQRAAGQEPYHGSVPAMMRDRNVELPWGVLRGVLEQIARVNGSSQEYQELAARGANLVNVSSLEQGSGHQRSVRRRMQII